MPKDLAIVLNNGSINSAVGTALAAQKFRPIMLHVDTEPTPGARSRAAYDQQIAHFKPYREHTISMPFLNQLETTTHERSISNDPRHTAPLGLQMQELLPLIAAAARYAAHYQAAAIYMGYRVGPMGEELAQATEYIQIWNELMQIPCNMLETELVMPLLEMDRWQVVDLGFQVAAPFERTWSCIEENGDPCWACVGCRAREQAFTQAAKADPLRVVRKL